MACEDLEELPNREYSDTVASCGHNEIEVAFEIVVSGDEISRVTLDSCLQDLVVIGIAAFPQITGDPGNGCPGHDKAKECLDFLLGVAKPSREAGAPEDLRNLGKLWKRCDDLEFGVQPARNDSAGRARGLQEGRDPDVGVKQGDDEHGVLP